MITLAPFVFVLLAASFQKSVGESGCPEPDTIQPCACNNSPYPVLECQNIDDVDALRTVFQNSARYDYREVHIEYSSLQFLPKDMFEQVSIKSLYLKNVSLVQLFDDAPETLHMLDNLFIENTNVMSRMRWDLLQPLTKLRLLTIYFNSIKTLDTEFSQYVTTELEQLTFYGTRTKKIKPEVFKNFTKLNKIAMDACELTELSRDMFPIPFDVEVLYFNDNKLSSIPDDLFTQMPKLQTLGLRKNQIAVVPEAAFSGRSGQITYLWFDDNPIKCDCLLEWLIKPENKPEDLRGSCLSPKTLHGRELSSLTPNDFHC